MRIAFDTFNLGRAAGSGNKTYTVELIKALGGLQTADEWQLITYWRKKSACRAIFGDRPGCSITARFPHPLLLGSRLKRPVQALSSIAGLILARECELFHCTNPINFPFSMPRVATTICDLIALRNDPWTSPGSILFYRKHLDTIIERSLCIYSISEYTKTELLNRYPGADGRIIVTPLAAGPRFAPVKSDRSFLRRFGFDDPERPYVLTVGDIQPRKNIIGMLRTFESLDNRFRDVRFIVVGRVKGPLSESAMKEIGASPKRDRIQVLQNVSDDDLVLFYNHAIGFIFYSFFEGFGLPVIEAMQCGCPVAAADNSSLTEIAKDAALLVDPYNLESMRDGMTRLIENGSLRNDLRKKGFERAARFSWKTTAEITYHGYKKVLGVD